MLQIFLTNFHLKFYHFRKSKTIKMEVSDDNYHLKHNEHWSSMSNTFRGLRYDKSLVDVTLCCEGRKIAAHKVLLSANSPYFRNIFEVPSRNLTCRHFCNLNRLYLGQPLQAPCNNLQECSLSGPSCNCGFYLQRRSRCGQQKSHFVPEHGRNVGSPWPGSQGFKDLESIAPTIMNYHMILNI
jgi:hypothetical protein